MPRETILRDHYEKVSYSQDQWNLLNEKRNKAIKIMKLFSKEGLNLYIYGSLARGNVHRDSDIDIIFLTPIPIFKIELILNMAGFTNIFREIIMATPKDSIKLYIHLSELECITLPITRLEKKGLEFYDFGGKTNIRQLEQGIRIPGVDKRLIYIKPTPSGHEEMSLINNESIIAKELGIGIESINERIKILLRREKYGKTGVFLKRSLKMDESVEEVLIRLAKKKSIIRKKMHSQ